MKKVLILAYDFPPYVSVGALRPYSWYKYLHEFGLDPIIVTRQWDNKHENALDYIEAGLTNQTIIEKSENATVIRAPYFPSLSNRLMLKYGEKRFIGIRKIFTLLDEIRQFMFPIGPKSTIYKAGKEYLKKNKVDTILATGEPFVMHYYASLLSKEFNIPWIADYRDPWSQNKGRQKSIFRYTNPFFEKRVLKTVTAISTVSEFFQLQIAQLTRPQTPFHIVCNGYDPEVIDQVSSLPQASDKLRISFVGTVYQWHPWKIFLLVFNEWTKANPEHKVEIHLYGINNSNEIESYVLNDLPEIQKWVIIHPKIVNSALLPILSQSNVLLLFNYYSFMGTKIYDYLGLKRKILLCFENDPEAEYLKDNFYNVGVIKGYSQRIQAQLIEDTKGGIVVKDKQHLKVVFDSLWQEFCQSGHIACYSTGTEVYSRKIQAQKLAEILKAM